MVIMDRMFYYIQYIQCIQHVHKGKQLDYSCNAFPRVMWIVVSAILSGFIFLACFYCLSLHFYC